MDVKCIHGERTQKGTAEIAEIRDYRLNTSRKGLFFFFFCPCFPLFFSFFFLSKFRPSGVYIDDFSNRPTKRKVSSTNSMRGEETRVRAKGSSRGSLVLFRRRAIIC